jgi:hypothetical protein
LARSKGHFVNKLLVIYQRAVFVNYAEHASAEMLRRAKSMVNRVPGESDKPFAGNSCVLDGRVIYAAFCAALTVKTNAVLFHDSTL